MRKNGKKIFGIALVSASVIVTTAYFLRLVKYLARVLEGSMIVSGRCYDEAYHKEE